MNKFYDVDLPFGEIYEKKLRCIFGNKKFEVKTERDIWKTTGNVCIELEYKKQNSGLNITQADYWCHIFQDNGMIKMMLIFPVHELQKRIKKLIKDGVAKLEYGGDDKESLLCLVPLDKLMEGGDPPVSCGTFKM